ncbi:hypothetical protein GCM10023194_62910 [Planotetraspora phitsanulokensis]|uniref:DUF4240 domain-containing protein n=1 Tax=Planotetraspora phitsanulokensis TaxID=575192 RepID=A0A8J3XID8_9ACTN|nr:DUF4240 domain-containing protein [Planotetraspora phitsanulokensis]GII37488.1 hypothetical protein Pph01_24910 [Planotetraspora phitsanulokensis]
MNTEDVWRLVDEARSGLDEEARGDADAVAGRMVGLLSRRTPAEIVAFAQPLWDLLTASYRADLWAAAYVINGGASDDGFDYFRGWLVAQGEEVYGQAVADPDSLAGLPAVERAHAREEDIEGADVLGVAWNAHLAVTGEELPDGAFTIRHPRLDPDWDFDFDDEDEMRRRLPRLTALYYG